MFEIEKGSSSWEGVGLLVLVFVCECECVYLHYVYYHYEVNQHHDNDDVAGGDECNHDAVIVFPILVRYCAVCFVFAFTVYLFQLFVVCCFYTK